MKKGGRSVKCVCKNTIYDIFFCAMAQRHSTVSKEEGEKSIPTPPLTIKTLTVEASTVPIKHFGMTTVKYNAVHISLDQLLK